jgi:hypothetical protein
MSAAEVKRSAKREAAIERSRRRRSENMRTRSLKEVRAEVHDSAVRVGALARRTDRADLQTIGFVVEEARRWITPTKRPCASSLLGKYIARFIAAGVEPGDFEFSQKVSMTFWHMLRVPGLAEHLSSETEAFLRRPGMPFAPNDALAPAASSPHPERPASKPAPGWVRELLERADRGELPEEPAS